MASLKLRDAKTGKILATSSGSTIIYNEELKKDREYQVVVFTFLDAIVDENSFMISSKVSENNPITYGSGPKCK